MRLPPHATFATRPSPLCVALRSALRPSPQSALLALGLLALQGPALGQSLDLSALDGTNGYVANGADAGDYSGASVSDAGDVNGDGIDDLLIGASGADPGGRSLAGESYVVFGRTNVGAALELSALDGTNGFVLNGRAPYDYSGLAVSGAGDVNGDGIDDLLIGAHKADRLNPPGSNSGESYVVFGRTDGFAPVHELSALDGTDGFALTGLSAGDYSGRSVSGAGDVNGDGIDDLVIGANQADPGSRYDAGESYVVFGRTDGFAAAFELSALDGINGFVLNGIDAGDLSGASVSGAGDVNGDGIDDLVIGGNQADPGGRYEAGESYVVFGRTDGFAAAFQLSALDGINGFVLNGTDAGDLSGASVSGAGDVNGDGIDDLVIGANQADPGGRYDAGESYVVFGKTGGFGTALELSALDGINGFVLNGIDAYDLSGCSVSGAGDINGDGIDDLILGTCLSDKYASGESYVVFGRTGGFGSALELSALDGAGGFILNGIDPQPFPTHAVSGAGDVNGDGIDDLLIGDGGANPGDKNAAGESYLVFGARPGRVCSAPGSAIPGGNPGGLTDTLATFGNSRLMDLNVEIRATHTWVGDLVFELEHTIGTTSSVVGLINRPGAPASPLGCDGADIDAVLDDQAATPVESECAPATPTIAGTFIPNESLSFFDGDAIGGSWSLTAIDSETPETGTLDEWCLLPWYQPLSPCVAVDLPVIRILFNGLETCLGENTLTARDTLVGATADVAFLSPAVTLGPGFRVEAGAVFSVGLPPP